MPVKSSFAVMVNLPAEYSERKVGSAVLMTDTTAPFFTITSTCFM